MYQLLWELEQLKESSTKSSAANKGTSKYKKQCQILQSLREKENIKLDKSYTMGYVFLSCHIRV